MASLLTLSKRQPDLLTSGEEEIEPFTQKATAEKKNLEAPKNVHNDGVLPGNCSITLHTAKMFTLKGFSLSLVKSL